MNTTAVQLTPFEEELLDLFRNEHDPYSMVLLNDCSVVRFGKQRYGPKWGGKGRVNTHSSLQTHPLVTRFLGRLRKKGLLDRYDTGDIGDSWGRWTLSDTGRELFGLPLLDSVVKAGFVHPNSLH